MHFKSALFMRICALKGLQHPISPSLPVLPCMYFKKYICQVQDVRDTKNYTLNI